MPHVTDQFVDTDRFRETAVELHEILGIEFRRDEHDFDVRELGADPTAKSHAVDAARHSYIRQHKPNIIAVRQHEHRFTAVGCFDDRVSSGSQFLSQVQPNKDLILYNEDRTLCQPFALSCSCQFDCSSPARVTLNGVAPNQFQ